jgi:D-alanyl-D-alanine carboxypeptidase
MKHHNIIGIALVVVAIVTGVIWANKRDVLAPKQDSSKTSQADTTPTTTAPKTFDKTLFSTSDSASLWVVVNKKSPLNPLAYAPADLTAVGSGQYMRAEAAQALAELFSAAKIAGYNIYPVSGYRSYTTQVSVYNNEVKNFGQAVADTQSARPGYSEHQTGWVMDFGNPGCIEDCFGGTPAAAWALANAYQYGFLLRYPEDKTAVTGYRGEPWHFRYVGKALSQEMHAQNVETLEEFFGLPAAPSY